MFTLSELTDCHLSKDICKHLNQFKVFILLSSFCHHHPGVDSTHAQVRPEQPTLLSVAVFEMPYYHATLTILCIVCGRESIKNVLLKLAYM